MSAARPLVAPPDPSTSDHFVYLRVGWQDYEKLLAMRGERSVPRITYLKGLDDDNRPDIAIEVVWTSGGIDKLEVYRKLGLREVWFYERGSLRFFALRTVAAEDA